MLEERDLEVDPEFSKVPLKTVCEAEWRVLESAPYKALGRYTYWKLAP